MAEEPFRRTPGKGKMPGRGPGRPGDENASGGRPHPTMELLLGLVGIGILGGLLLLGAQMKANTQAIRAETFQALVGQSTRLLESIYSNPDVAEIFSPTATVRSWEDLPPIKRARAHSALLAAFRTFDNMVYQYRQGTLDDEFWAGNRELITSYADNRLWKAWFDEHRRLFSRELGRIMDGLGEGA